MKQKRIVIVGGGFAGVWAAMGASRLLRRHGAESRVAVTLLSPDDALVIRPRLYESDLSGVRVPLGGVLSPVGIDYRRATVERIDTDGRRLTLAGHSTAELAYDQLVLCAGSRVRLPEGAEGVHCVDSYEQAAALHQAVSGLAERPGAPLSVTIIGAGFTGLELATELSDKLREAVQGAGASAADVSVRLVERAGTVAPEFGPKARLVIEDALRSLEVEAHTGVSVSHVDADGVTLANGERVEGGLTIWAAGPRANALNEQLGLPLDAKGRLAVDSHMATGIDGIWAAGDSASVTVDGKHLAMMSCQQAMPQGRQAGENAAATILGRSPGRYTQPLYLTCLDLGSAGGLLTCGYERDTIIASGERGKRFKRWINRSLIYPPAGGGATEMLGLGKPATAGALSATIQQMALRSNALRNTMISRSDDRAEQYSMA
ncbi:MAG TPA: FAD-dependent oxidoreductase [Solirubrobacterales bacterium]|jgi:NADH dehydrogenase|nr:FAD-dependent oxidoreductase [Solirubrobacterales bacterium]